MSHFTVMVQVPKHFVTLGGVEHYLDRILAPFDENREVEPYVSKTAEELKAVYEEKMKKHPDYEIEKMSLEDFANEWYGQSLDQEGNLLSTYNPKSKWDWWTIGGRWSGLLRLKSGDTVDYAEVQHIDFDGILEDNAKRRAEAWKEVHNGGEVDGFRKYLYGIKTTTLEEHVATATGLTTFAVVTKDGQWHEKGEMGWFGVHNATEDAEQAWDDNYYKNFIEPLDPEDVIVIVDCHI